LSARGNRQRRLPWKLELDDFGPIVCVDFATENESRGEVMLPLDFLNGEDRAIGERTEGRARRGKRMT
jgi:hypothetical protein